MQKPEKQIVTFLKKHHVLTLATCNNGQPWCANCFYAYDEDDNVLIFTSDDQTRHAAEAIKNNRIAGSVVLETSVIGKIQGIQFEGTLIKADDSTNYKMKYIKRFPFAILSTTSIWVAELSLIKMTDNRLGFGKKLIWQKEN